MNVSLPVEEGLFDVLARLLLVCMLFFCAMPGQAHAEPYALGPNLCVLANDGDVSAVEAKAQIGQFSCDKRRFSKAAKHYWLHGELDGAMEAFDVPVLRMRVARHGAVDLVLMFADGHTETAHYSLQDMKENWRAPSHTAMSMRGATGERPVQFLLGVDQPWDPWNLSDLQLIEHEEDLREHRASYLFNAVSCALLVAPFLIGAIFFVALRQRYLAYYLLGSASVIITQLLWGGVAFDLVPTLTLPVRSVLAHITIASLMFAVMMLVRELCGPQKLGVFAFVWMRRVAILPPLVTLPLMVISPGLPVLGSMLFHLAIFAPIPFLLFGLVRAALNGSRTALGMLFGTSGFVIIALVRILKSMDVVSGLPTFDHGFYYATILDAAVMCILVCMRAVDMRVERDKAVQENSLLFEYATTDPLTGLLNRRALDEAYREQVVGPDQRRGQWAMLVLDLDHFKSVNDEFGHDGGDCCLIQFARLLEMCCRPGDISARIGGEEFVVLAKVADRSDAEVLASRIRSVVADNEFGDANAKIGKITTSIGVAMIPHSVPVAFDTVYRLADQALYAAKAAGRDRVMVAELSATFGKRAPVEVKQGDGRKPLLMAREGRFGKY